MTPAEHVEHARATLAAWRYSYGNELALHDWLEQVLTDAGLPTEREHRIDHGRVDFYLPAGRVALEVKVDGSPGDVVRQLTRYANSGDVDGLVLVTARMQHVRHIPAELNGKPVAVVYLGAGW